MKKTYLKPEAMLTIISMNVHLCTGSPDPNNPTTGLDDDNPPTPGGDDPGDFSRRLNIWDED